MDKILEYPSRDQFGTHVRSIDLDSPRSIDGLDKYASSMHPSVREFVDSWEPMDGHTAWLIDALGSDVYGNNINGDRFPREMLAHEGKDYGHKTFEHFGYPFFHHINKDPKFAYGPKVPLAVWQPEMERVQVVAWWSHELCGDLMDRLLDGEIIDVSMGCRVPFDQCTLCGNKARKRSQYCDHLRNEMNDLQANGIKVGAINWYPKFFDISRVVRGAEKCSKFMVPIGVSFRRGRIVKTATVADTYATRSSAELFEKVAGAMPDDVVLREALMDLDAKIADEKYADIEKRVASNLTPSPEAVEMSDQLLQGMSRLRQIEPDLPPELLNTMGKEHPLKSILTTMLGLGVVPKPKEFQRIVLVSLGKKDDADKYERAGQCFGERDHEGQEHSVNTDAVLGGPSDLSPDIGKMLAPLLGGRSCYKPALAGRTMVIIKRAAAGPMNFDEFGREERKPLPLVPLAVGLAALHGAFKKKMTGSGMAEIGAAAAKNPVLLALLTALGVGAVEAHRQVAVTRSNPFAHIEKEAAKSGPSGMGLMARYLGLPAAAYVYSDMKESERMRGQYLSRAEDFVRRNPDLTSLGLVFGAPSLLRGARSGLRGVGSLLKQSSLLGEIGSSIPMYALFSKAGPALPLAATGAALDVAIFEGLGKLLGSKADGS